MSLEVYDLKPAIKEVDGETIKVDENGVISTALKTVNGESPDSNGNITVNVDISSKVSKMVKTPVDGSYVSIGVESGKAYTCLMKISSLTLTALPGEDNYEESSIWFSTSPVNEPTLTISSGVSYKTVGDLTLDYNKTYVLSIMANTLILEEVGVGA